MSVYVDSLTTCMINKNWKYTKSCHLFADTINELNAFADTIGLQRRWFQNHPRLPHYDLNYNKRARAIEKGAIEVTQKQVVVFMHTGII